MRKDSIRIKYNDFVFNNISELARKINVNARSICSFMYAHNIKAEDYQIDLNCLKYKEFRKYIENKTDIYLLNLIRCESHREKIITTLEYINKDKKC